ncbi:MAG: CoxG family protein [Acidothermaceae bacterium]
MPSMTFERELSVGADAAACWRVLTDVPRLVGWISVVQDAQEISKLDRYTAVLMDRLGPFKLRADLEISLSDVEECRRVHVNAAGEDRQVSSRISVDATLNLNAREGGGTVISVNGTYEVVGRVATLGAGMIRAKATKILDEFFEHAAAELAGR